MGILRYTPSFYSCLNNSSNDDYNFEDKNLIDLGISSFKLAFREEGFFMLDFANNANYIKAVELKRTYNQNLPDILWRLALDKKVKVLDIKNNNQITADRLEQYNFISDYLQEKFDTASGTPDTIFVKRNLRPEMISSVNISQHFYFDKRKNILRSSIKEVYVFIRNYDHFTFDNREVCIAEIVF